MHGKPKLQHPIWSLMKRLTIPPSHTTRPAAMIVRYEYTCIQAPTTTTRDLEEQHGLGD